jgi:hypothetical protein
MRDSAPCRTCFFVDGFNLYHSICSAEKTDSASSLKWLDLAGLFKSHLDLVDPRAKLRGVKYYTAYADHLADRSPEKSRRHRAYVRALTAVRVEVQLHHFKRKDAWDTHTRQRFVTHEEKETDVAIACDVLEGAARDQFDVAVLVTGDTDLRPAVQAFQRLYPSKRLLFAFPFNRKNSELTRVAPGSFSLSAQSYADHQLPDRVKLPSGKHVYRPAKWAPSTSG